MYDVFGPGEVSLSDLQLSLTGLLWARGEASAAESGDAIRDKRELAHIIDDHRPLGWTGLACWTSPFDD